MEDIQKADKCVIIMEPNGDLSEQVARQDILDKGRLVYVDCSFTPRTPRINPFELINLDNELDIEKQSQVIRNALVQIFSLDGQPLTLQMQSILQPCIEIVAKQKGTLADLQRFMVDGINEDLLEAGQQSQKHGDFFNFKFGEGNLLISRQGIYQKLLNLLNFSVFADFFCGDSTIDLRKAIDEKKVILFNLSKGKLGSYSSSYIGMMLVAVVQNLIFQRATVKENERTPVRIYIDEFQDFVADSSEQIFVQGRKYHVGLTVASQIVGQKMTSEMTKIVLGNTDTKFVGVNGYESLRVMSKETFTEIEQLNKLSVGRFFCRIFNGQSFVLQVPTKHLDWTTCIKEEEWAKVLDGQINRYYVPRTRKKQPENNQRVLQGNLRIPAIESQVFSPKY